MSNEKTDSQPPVQKLICPVCPHHCSLAEGQTGFCRARTNRDGKIRDDNYGYITSACLDPIEKKPLAHFYPGSSILSVGSYGCNMRCDFCQNHSISMSAKLSGMEHVTPNMLVDKARALVPAGNIGLAFTYNEPLIGWEFVRDTETLNRDDAGLKNVVVTNGFTDPKIFKQIAELTDAFNIDLKAFNRAFYKRYAGDLETVKTNIETASAYAHVEVACLIIPGLNDSPEEIRKMARFLNRIDPEIVLHVNRFFPCYKMTDRPPTPADTIYSLAEEAKKILPHVYTGNL